MSRATPLIRTLSLVSVFLLAGLFGDAWLANGPLALDVRAQGVATIASDAPEYTPGHNVTLTGGGWTPGETVNIVLHREPQVSPDVVLTQVADAGGTITDASFAPAPEDVDVTFTVTATGSQSGLQATTTFSARAAITWTGLISTDWNQRFNWSTFNVPGNNDDVTIPNNVSSGRYPVVSGGTARAESVVLATGAIGAPPTLTVSGGTLTIGEDLNVANSNATVTVSGGTLTVLDSNNGEFRVDGTLNVSAGTVLSGEDVGVTNSGRVNVSGTGTVHLATSLGANPSDDIVLSTGSRFTQSGGSVDTRDFISNGTASYQQSGGTFRVYRNFVNAGNFNATAGTIVFAGSGDGDDFDSPGENQFFNVIVATGVDTDFASDLNARIKVGGDWTMNGDGDLVGRDTTVTFNGGGAQTIGGARQTTFRNLYVDKTAGTVTLARSAQVTSGDVKVLNGTLDLATFTLNRSNTGGEIGVANGAFLKIGGTNTFPQNYATHTFQPISTVNYYGTDQTVTSETYGHLTLSTSGVKTMPILPMTTQGNFTMSGAASATSRAALTVNGNFTLGVGTTFAGGSPTLFDHRIKGNFSNSGTFNAGASTFAFNGIGTQTIGGSTFTTFNNLTIDNPGGVALSGVDTIVNGLLTLTSGNVTTGPNQFIATSATGTVSRTSGHVVGNFRKFVPTGATVLTYEIGDSGAYTPVTMVFSGVTDPGNLTGSTTPGDHPNTGTSPVDRLKSVNRYWTFTNSGVLFTNYSATFNFVLGDLDAGANTGAFIVGKVSGGAWTTPTVGTRTITSTQITGVTSFSDFQIGESAQITTLGTGLDPGDTTVAPGGAATMAGAFTFQTDGSTDTVTAVTVTLTPGTAAGLLLLEITDNAGSTVYGSVNPLSDTPSIALSPGIPVTALSTQYKIRVTPESHAAMPAPPGSTYAVTAHVTSWTGSNFNHAGSDGGGTTVTIDNLSPANVSSSTATFGNAQVTLAWTNPLTSDLGTIVVLRRPASAVGDTPAEGATYSVGNTIGSSTVACVVAAPATGCTDSGLTNGTAYHYKVFSKDTNGNYAIGAVPTGSPVTPNVTTLGNGADPAGATLAPGGAAAMADAFTFQTSSGTDAITGVTVTMAPGASAGVSLVEITNDTGAIVYGSVSGPSSDTPAIPLTTPITATTTITQYKIRVTPKSHLAMPVPPGASYALTASVVGSWTGTNVQAGSDSGGTTITIDNLSPDNVTAATATAGSSQITLAWTNPAASDLHSIVVLRRAGAPVATSPTEGVNYFDGDTIGSSVVACIATAPATTCTDGGLDNGTVYHYKIFARDANRNYAVGVVPTGSPATPTVTTLGDGTAVSSATIAPGGAGTMANAFTFQTASGTDAITAIALSLASGTSAAVSLVEITNVAGTLVYGSVGNPSSDTVTIALTTNLIATTTSTRYRIRVTPKSHAAMPAPPGSDYAVSVHITDWTGTNAHDGTDSGDAVITIDNLSPGNVTNASASAGSTLVVLTGTKPLDIDLESIIVLRRAGSAVTDTPVEGATYSVGNTIGSSTVACVITSPTNCIDLGLINGTAYHYKVFARDTHGNYSTGVVPAGSPATPFAGITVTPTSGLTTTEAGGTATFTVVLTSRPVADVTIGLSSSDTTEGTLSTSSLIFTTVNWNIPQTVTVTGVNDDLDDGNIAYSIITAPATSAGGYNGVDASDVAVTNTDNDTAGITVSPTSGLSTTEAGGTATFTVVLNTQPTAGVTIGLSSSDATEGTVSPASVTFTAANWNQPQTVTVTGVNDAVADGNIAYTIVTAPAVAIGDTNYDTFNASDVSVTNIDNNTVGIIVNPSSGLITTEAGGTATFSVVLNSQPIAAVTVGLSSSNTTEGTISASSLTFTAANWNTPQSVTITGVNDNLDDGDIGYTIITAVATSGDSNYSGLNPSDVAVINTDDDTAGITVTPTSGLTTTEAGGAATFTVVLNSQPTADVTIGLSSGNTTEGTLSLSSLTFTNANWNTPQTVTVTGVNDFQDDGDLGYLILTAPASSSDGKYNGLNASDVAVINADNDAAGITVTPTSGLTTTEAGGTATFTIVLNSQPTADVTIGLISSDLTEGLVSPASVTFTSVNWNLPQTVTVTGVSNAIDDGDIAYTIVTAPATSGDPKYNEVDASDVSVINIDDDTAGIIVTPTSGLITSEIGGEAPTFTVVLASRPTANVVINLSSSDTTEGAVSPVSLTFTSANWNIPQTVTVHGVNDVVDDGDIVYTIVTAPATSGDPVYSGMNASDVSVTNIDSDVAGFFVTPISGLTTTEAGGRSHFTVVLNTQPSADVIIALSSSNPSEGTVSPASLTFTSANWNIPQTVDVVGVNDAIDDGDIGYTIVTAAAVSADPGYNGLNPFDVTATNIDNDAAGIVLNPLDLTTTEAGGTATFTIVLNSQPTADVTIALSSSNPSEGTVSLPSVTFTAANWNTPRTVTVTGVDDLIDDGDITYAIITAAATSSDLAYNGLNALDVSVINTDDDTAGITLTPTSGLVTTEAGGAASFTVVLTAQPTANVTIGLISADTTEGTLSAGSVTFTTANWNVPQTITVTGVNDALDDGDIAYDIVTTPASSSDSSYNGLATGNVSVTNTDNDAAGITVTPTFGLTTTEAGGTATFTVVLTSQPTADVTIGLSSNDATEGTVGVSSLTFTPANWYTPQTVTVTGVNDVVDDGDISYAIVTAAAASSDPNYNLFDASNVLVTNTDDDVTGITVTPTAGLTTTEAGGTATYTVVLTSQPAADVTIAVSSTNTAEGTVSVSSLTFTPANWNIPQTVTVTGVNDAIDDGDMPYDISNAPATSADPSYNGVDPIDVSVTNADGDTSGIIVSPISGRTTTEGGGTTTFAVVLRSQPTADVTIGLSSDNTAEGTVSPASLTFTAANWNTPQTVTVTGVNDALDDGDIVYRIVTAAAVSADLNYGGFDAIDVPVINIDDDAAGITVSPTSGLTTTEAGGSATFTVALTSQPTADVVIGLNSSNTAEGTVAASVTFTSANWNTPQVVTVTGVNDALDDGDIAYTIVTAAVTSADVLYNGIDAADVAVTNIDNDAAGITVTPTSGLTTTEAGGTATFTVVLTSQPTADVSIGLSTSDATEGTISAPSLTFTAANWNLPQTVTITGVNDALDDGDIAYSIVTAAATSADSNYAGLSAADVTVSNTDDDVAGITVTAATTPLTTTEAGGTATFTVVLNTQPTQDVMIALSSSTPAEGSVFPASLVFTSANWNVAQTVTVTGVDDLVVDGPITYTIVTAPAVSSDANYNTRNAADVLVTNSDNDIAGITVTAATTPLTTTEAGGTATFTVTLNTQPTANVTIALTSSNPAEGTVAPASLVFTSANWNVAQTVTVTGADDLLVDGPITYTIVTAPAVSTDPNYNTRDAADVLVTNSDNDVAGITVTAATTPLTTTEAGGTATFTVRLNTQPTANVTIALSSSNPAEGTALPASLVFTTANWNVAQTVTVTGADDAVVDGSITYTIVTAPAVSTDANYNTRNAADVLVTNSDNDVAGITVTAATTPLTTTEAGGTATFTVRLNTQPTADVTMALSSSNPAEGTVAPASLVFTSANWNVAQTVTVTGADDTVVDGPITYTIVTAPAVSTDANYNTRNAADVLVTNSDNDLAGITVTAATTPLATSEAGATATFTVVLNSQPTANVTIALSSTNTAEGTVGPALLTFTPGDWNVAQTVTVTGVDDLAVDGPITYTIVTAAAVSTDPSYNTRNAADVLVTNSDNDSAGITVTAATTPLTTTEAGGTATFTVVLNTQPTSNVTIALTSSNPAEGTVFPASLVFTTTDWNVAQTVTVTGADDLVVDGPITYTIVTAPAVSSDPNYNTRDAADVLVTNADNDLAGITVTATPTPLATTEAGGTATFTVVLNSQPTANVTIALSSSNPAEGTVLPASLVFTSANWNVAQTVTVTGADDAIADGPITYTIATAPAVSTDANYNTRDAADVLVTNADNDVAGITVTAAPTPLATTEAGGTATFTVMLNTRPTANVTIALSSTTPAEGTVLPASLVFTSANWNVAQTVTVTGVDDLVADGPITYTIVTAPAVSADANYNTRDAADVLVTNSDNDNAGITVTPTSGLTTTEAGGTATFTVVLTSQPTANVTIAVSSNNTAEGAVSPALLTFTPGNWNVAQTVTVTGVDDAAVDGPITYTIVTAAAVSTDTNYNTRNAADVLVTNADNDVAGITVTAATTPLTTSEAGGTAAFTVVLNSQPTDTVTIAVSSNNTAEGTVAPTSLIFTPGNWNVAQTVTVTGVDDAVVDGPITYTIVTAPAVSTDLNYSARNAADVFVTNSDNDTAGITVTAATTPLATTEAGGTATFTVVLNSQPTANVTIALGSSNPAEGGVSPAGLLFTPGNWNVAQTVTVTGVDDAVVDGPITYTIVTAPAVSTDANYHTRNAADVLVTNSDNDTAGIVVTAATTPLTTTEAGGTAAFTVVLSTQPTAIVTIAVSSSNTAEGTVSPALLTFTPGNWNVAQTVTVTGADDTAVDGPITYTIVTAPAVSTDANYNTRDAADVLVTNSDNDSAGITVTAATTPLATSEAGGSATFTVVLNSQPTANVTIALSSSTPAEGTVSPALLTFTAGNWNVAQTVTVTGVDDAVVDGPITYTILTAPAVSADANYNTRDAADVLVTNSDNDSAGITVTAATTPLTTTEAGGTATFAVVLNTQPTANVTIALSSSNPAEGGVAPTSLVFTAADWNVAQTVTVTGADDAVVDGPITYTIVTAPAVSADPNYSTRDAADVLVTNTDNDVAGITVTAATTPLATTEAGGTATFTVVLNSQPTANVTIALSSSTPAEGTVAPTSLVFTPGNWNVAQTVTVTGADDAVVDGPITYTIATAPAVSTDANYNTRNAADVLVTNSDNDVAGITVTAATTPLTTTEAGGTATFTVVLNTQPAANVTIPLSSSNPAEGTVAPASLIFTPGNWNVAQAVTVTGADDLVADGPITYTIVTAAAVSTDANYNTRNAADVLVTNSDNDTAGITVTAATPLATTEAGGAETFTVVLNSQPTANVTIALSSSNPTEGGVTPTSLLFTPGNWNVAQTVTVTGVDDAVVDGPITYTIVTAPAVSTDLNYNTRNAADVLVTNSDNDTAGITVTAATTPLATTEAGGTATFTVVLNTQPTANVAFALSSSNPAEGTVSPTILVFTSANWATPQTVTVTGADDLVADGPITFTIVTAPAVSTDVNYNTRDASDVLVTNSDNDVAGITVTAATTPLATTEAGGTATFTVVLNTQPTANVTMAVSSNNTVEGTVAPTSLVFTSANWNVAQTVTVTGADDLVVDGPITYTIVTAPAVSADPNYNTRDAADVLVTNADNDVAGITVTATPTPLATTESGGAAQFTVVLNSQPTANVTIGLSSNNTAEGTVSPASLTFTTANWNVAQSVTVTGADDLLVDGPITYTIVTAPAVSTDANYNTRDAADVLVTNSDNDVAGITVTAATTPLTTTEAGGTATFTVVLNTQPTANVTMALSSSNPAEGTVFPASLTFTTANWNVAQTVTVTGADDLVVDGPVTYTIVTAPAVSADTNYNARDAADVLVTNSDNDVAGITVTATTTPLTTTEAGGTATFTVVLNTQPTANVTIALSSNNTAEGTVNPALLTFTPANWNVAQTVTVTGADDTVVDGPITYTIVTAPAVSTDLNYNTRDAANVLVTNSDNDVAGITVTAATTPLTTTEAGGTATFTVVLNTQPTANVTIALSSNNTAEGTVSPALLTFAPANWNVAQTVTVTGVDDTVVDGSLTYTIVTAPAVSADANYNTRDAADVLVTNADNDVAGITVTAATTPLTTTESGGTATFTVVLNTQPTANVTIGLSSNNTAEGTVSPASLTFTTANWNVAQTVTVTGVDDVVVDGSLTYTIVTAPAVSTDPNYNTRDAANVLVTNTDNDVAGITVTAATTPLTTTESGGTATFTVVLNTQPTADVTIGLTSSNAAEGTVSPASLTFTTANWNVAQTVTVTGVNDGAVDGNIAYTIVTAAATSADLNYAGVNASDVAVTNNDDDVFADLSVTKTNGVTGVTAGSSLTYTVVVSNAGPGGVVGATVTDAAPANVTFGTWTCVASAGSTCPASGTGNIATAVNLLAGGTATFTVPATVSAAASGTVINTATVSTAAGAVDPTPANNIAVDTDAVSTVTDLSVTMTNGTSSVTAAGPTTYVIVVTNAGANAAGGAVITDVGSGVAMTALTCAAGGGAVCPATPTVAQLQAGLVIPTLPVGGSVTFTLVTIVTAASGTVTNTATVTAPAGVVDTNPANNSATDSDAVVAAPAVADLAVVITDNMTVLVPGSGTVYTIIVTNQGPSAVAGVTVTNTAPAGLTFGNWTCVASAGSSCDTGGTGNISTIVNLLAGGTAVFSVPATLTPGAPASIANTVVATVPAGVIDPAPANNTATDVNQAVLPQIMGVGIRAGTMTAVGPSAFEVPFTVDISNIGANPLTNLQVADSLSSAFVLGTPTITIVGPPTVSGPAAGNGQVVAAASTVCVANNGFTGIGAAFDPGTQLLSGALPIDPGQGCTIDFRVRLTYASISAIPTEPQFNTAVARTSSGAGGATIANASSSTAIELQIPRVDVTKMLTGVKQLDTEPVFDISYAIVLRNTSQVASANVQVTDDLAATFAPGAPGITIVSGPAIESGNGSLTLATGANAFNGTTRTAMLIGSDTMMPGAESRIGFTVRVRYASGAVIPVGVDLNNSAIATTSATSDGVVITRDESTDVTDSGAPPRADDVPDPTTVRLAPRAQLSVQKLANVLVAEIGDTVQYAVRVRNVTGPALPAVSVTDKLPLGFRYIAGSARLGATGAAQPLPDPAGGVGPVLTFAIPAQSESAEALVTYRVRIGTGALQGDGVNRADAVSGDVTSNTATARVLVSGGVFTTDACVIGAIFVDLNGNGLQDAGEPGVPDVALHLEEGTSIVTDLQGKYSYCGLTPTTHVLKVDGTTLPAGATLTTSSNRNAGNAGSLFVDLKFGEVHRADFIVDGRASQAVIDEIGVRRARLDVWAPKFDEPAPAGVSGGRPLTGTGAVAGSGLNVAATGQTQNQTAGGFEPIRQASGLNPANSNAPEPPPGAADAPVVNGVVAPSALPPSTTLRQMLLVGLLDGAVSFSKVDGGLLAPARPEAVFDREFRRFTGSFDGGQGQYGGRGAVFIKGTVATHYLMTFAYDSDKDVRSALFRDIQPEAFYPIYGDGSEKRFDAQTSGRFYARVDRGHSYLMYGDLQTSSFGPEAQALGAYNRALTGVQQHFENSRAVVNLFASHDSLRQVIDEYAARGISGPYPVSNPNGVSGTERVEIITRDRNQPALVLSAVRLTRFTDYEFEPFSGRLLFRMPVPSLDEQLNPVSIRVTYEVDSGGDKSWVDGGNVQMRFGRSVQIGGSWIEDGTPGSPYRLISANTTLRLGKSSTLVIEAAQSTGATNTGIGGPVLPSAADVDAEGLAARIEWRHTSSKLMARAFGAISDPGFNNPASTLAGGRTEAGGRARWTIANGVNFIGEALHSEDRLTGGRRDGGLLTLETKWKPLVFEVGMRRATETGAPSQGTSAGIPLFGSSSASGFGFGSTDNRIDPVTGQPIVQPGFGPRLSAGPNAPAVESPDVMTVRAKLTVLIGKRANIYGEAEQDVRSAERRVAAVGTQLKFNDKVKLYARHEFISSLDGPYALTDGQKSYNTVFGLSSTYMKDGDLFSEYRLGDAISGREAEAAIGLRNHWTLAKGVRLSTGFERVQSIAGVSREATAASAGLEYTASSRLKGTGRLEWRQDSSSNSWLSTVGIAQRLSRDWTVLARNYYQLTAPEGAPNLVQDRVSIGAAYRDTAKNRLNLLTRYEFRIEDTAGLELGSETHRQVQVVSTHVDVHPLRAWTFSGQHALKFVDDRTETSPGTFGTQLVSGRVGFDISRRWDIGALTSVMWGGESGRRSAVGAEVGFQVRQGLWLSGGYNFTGFTDRDLVSSNFTTRGVFMRIRIKFDESIVPPAAKGGR